MNRRVVVTGIGLVSPLGDDAAALHVAACAGSHAGARQSEFAVNGMPGPLAAPHSEFDAKAELGRENLRPLDRTGRLAAAAARRALADSGWTAAELVEHEVGLVLGTMFGSMQTISGFDRRSVSAGPNYAKPMDFANSVINAAAGQAGIRFNLRGANATVSGDLTAGIQALGFAADLIRSGRVDAVLAGGADEICVESLYGFHKLGLLCPSGVERARALSSPATGMMLAEGAALLMLESEESAAGRGAKVLAEIRGHGSALDLSRGRDPQSAANSVAHAARTAFDDDADYARDLACASLGANGTASDEIELAAVADAYSPRSLLAVKDSTGEPLGAGGVLQTILAIESLRRGRFPSPAGGIAETDGGGVALVTSLGLQGKAAALVAAVN